MLANLKTIEGMSLNSFNRWLLCSNVRQHNLDFNDEFYALKP
jgi:hypothetical protein